MGRGASIALVVAGVLLVGIIVSMIWPEPFEPTLPSFGPGAVKADSGAP